MHVERITRRRGLNIETHMPLVCRWTSGGCWNNGVIPRQLQTHHQNRSKRRAAGHNLTSQLYVVLERLLLGTARTPVK